MAGFGDVAILRSHFWMKMAIGMAPAIYGSKSGTPLGNQIFISGHFLAVVQAILPPLDLFLVAICLCADSLLFLFENDYTKLSKGFCYLLSTIKSLSSCPYQYGYSVISQAQQVTIKLLDEFQRSQNSM